jgi:NADH-quinone oxidoreductase subunit J
MIQALSFYLFAGVLVTSALMVITARNPVHSVLFLILGFFNAAGLFVLLGAEFVAMILVIVYVGAVAVLFLFVVMMLDVSFAELRKGAMQYVPLGSLIGAVLMTELFILYKSWSFTPDAATNIANPAPGAGEGALTNSEALGMLLYTDYIFAFQIAGLVLLVAMIGAIVLTLRKRPDVRRQNVADQFARRPEDAMEVVKVTPETGV